MAAIRVMFIGHGPSGLPEDRIVNTFHFFDASTDYATQVVEALDAIEEFYVDSSATFPQTNPIGSWLSPWVQRSAELRAYDMAQPIPRVPTTVPITLPAAFGSQGAPEECAVCLTLHGVGLPVTPRRRGRVYLGPLSVNALDFASTAAPARPTLTFRQDLKAAAERLATVHFVTCPWSIRSTRPTPNFVKIDRGYIDNALDTQRRRGPDPTSRIDWGVVAI